MSKNSGGFSAYDKKIHSFGILSTIICIISLVAVPLVIQLISGATPEAGKVLAAMGGSSGCISSCSDH